MARMSLCPSLLVLFALLASAAGCGGADRAETAPASGVVLQDGNPVAGASVTLFPKEGGRSANGLTDENGRFVLTTYDQGDGAIPGEHQVAITAANAEVPEVIPDDYDYAKAGKSSASVPPKYSDPDNSGLTATIKSGQENELKFEL